MAKYLKVIYSTNDMETTCSIEELTEEGVNNLYVSEADRVAREGDDSSRLILIPMSKIYYLIGGVNDALVNELVKEAEACKIKDGCLDEYVHDACSCIASNVNNDGLYEQISFILNEHGVGAAKCIRELFKED